MGRGRPEHCGGGAHAGVVEQTLFNGVKAKRLGKLKGADSKPVAPSRWRSAGCGPSWRASRSSATSWEKRQPLAACAEPGSD